MNAKTPKPETKNIRIHTWYENSKDVPTHAPTQQLLWRVRVGRTQVVLAEAF